MDALLICGGRGTRLGDGEKPLVRVGGVPMVERVRTALADSRIDRTVAVTSPHVPETSASLGCPTIETPGEGYVADLQAALADDRVERPVLTVATDLPLLDGDAVDAVLAASDGRSLAVAVPAGRVESLGLVAEPTFRHRGQRCVPAGINVVGAGDDHVWVTRDRRLAVNVNRPAERHRADWLVANRGDRP